MECLRRDELTPRDCLGRQIWRVYGADAALDDKLSFGFARFSRKRGVMKPHYHEREWIYVLDAKRAVARYGDTFSSMNASRALQAGDFLRFDQDECHVFEFEDDEGYLDILWGFGTPMNHTVEIEP